MSTVFDADFAPRNGKKTGDFPPVFVSFYPRENDPPERIAFHSFFSMDLRHVSEEERDDVKFCGSGKAG